MGLQIEPRQSFHTSDAICHGYTSFLKNVHIFWLTSVNCTVNCTVQYCWQKIVGGPRNIFKYKATFLRHFSLLLTVICPVQYMLLHIPCTNVCHSSNIFATFQPQYMFPIYKKTCAARHICVYVEIPRGFCLYSLGTFCRAGNSLISFLSETLVFCERKSESDLLMDALL